MGCVVQQCPSRVMLLSNTITLVVPAMQLLHQLQNGLPWLQSQHPAMHTSDFAAPQGQST